MSNMRTTAISFLHGFKDPPIVLLFISVHQFALLALEGFAGSLFANAKNFETPTFSVFQVTGDNLFCLSKSKNVLMSILSNVSIFE